VTVARSKVFDETYKHYLEEIRHVDFLAKADMLGLQRVNNALVIPLYNKIYRFDVDGITGDSEDNISPAVQVMICKYILTCQQCPDPNDPFGELVTYREFKDAGPLISYFTTNTNKTLESTFTGDITALKKRGQEIGGKLLDSDVYDLSFEFGAFPRVPVILNFNDRDDQFPACCSILYRSSAEYYLDMECLAMTGTLLAGKLIAIKRII
jgi:hypothetical protein